MTFRPRAARRARDQRHPQAGIEALESRQLLAGTTSGAPAVALASATPARQMEYLTRGVVASKASSTSAYISWRLLGNDPSNIAFNLYRSANGAAATKLNGSPIAATTEFADSTLSSAVSNRYFVRPILNGVEQADSESFTLPANASVQQYQRIPLQVPPGGTNPDVGASTSHTYTYSANDVSVGDVDGDGVYEYIVKWDPSDAKDNSQSGYTGPVYVDAYRMDGTRLWRINLGRNIRAGAHYTQFQVYDYDGDGKAEVAMKTAPGTVDGLGNNVLMNSDDPNADYRNTSGYVLSGPEYLTMFNGLTGAAMSTVAYDPPRGTVSSWGDNYGNRVDRFLAGTAYLDGARPSLIMSRGYYTRTVIAAWDFRIGQLTKRWTFDSNVSGSQYAGQGNHQFSVADVDQDGKDEIIFGAMCIDDSGAPLWNTGFGHGDALHVGDLDPSRPGLEVFKVDEGSNQPSSWMADARTGQIIWQTTPNGDNGRGVSADVWAGSPGAESWSAAASGVRDPSGNVIPNAVKPGSQNFLIWWDGDPVRELLDGNHIDKYVGTATNRLLTASGASSNNGTKSTPAVSADLFGDWREEVVWRSSDSSELRIYTTTTPTTMRIPTLMHDAQYRVAVAWQNTAYNQPPHPSFFIGAGMTTPPIPNIYLAGMTAPGPEQTYQSENAVNVNISIDSNNAGFNGTGFSNFPTTNGYVEFQNVNGGAGGLASVSFRYALGAATSRAGTLTVNGVSQPITFQPTGAWTTWNLLTLNVPLNAGSSNTIRLSATGQDLANLDELRVSGNGVDTVAPSVTTSSQLYETSPNQLKFIFNEDVGSSLQVSDLVVKRNGTVNVVPTAVSYDPATTTATFTLPANLGDGNYQATFVANEVRDPSANALGSTFAYDFFVFAGDANHDRRVDVEDFKRLTANFGRTSGVTYADGDFNYDGKIDNADMDILSSHWNQTLSPPIGALPVSSPEPTSAPPPSSSTKRTRTASLASTVVP
jgi:hypothetical protein